MKKLLCGLVCLCAAAGVVLAQVEQEPPTTGLGVTRVTVSSEGRALSSVLDDLSQQAGVRFTVQQDLGRTPITLRATDKPLWQTLMAALYPVNNEGTFTFQMNDGTSIGSSGYSGKTYVAGPFLVLANHVVHQADFRRPDGDAEQFYVEIQVLVDPVLMGLFVEGDNIPAKALDDGGISLVPTAVPASRVVPLRRQSVGPGRTLPARILLARPAVPAQLGRRIASLQGEIPVIVAGKIETVELDVPGKTERIIGGVKGTFECKIAQSGGVQVSSQFDRIDGTSDDQWNEIDKRLFSTRQRIVDADGKAWPPSGGSGASYGIKVRSMSETFTQARGGFGPAQPAVGPARKAVIDVVTEVKTVKVPYQFGDLPLP